MRKIISIKSSWKRFLEESDRNLICFVSKYFSLLLKYDIHL